jgi:hypothetical protein
MTQPGSSLLSQCRAIAGVSVLTIALVIASACSDSSDSSGGGGGGGGGSTSSFLGIISSDDGLSSGEITIDLATASPSVDAPTGVAFASVTASGSHKLTGTAVAMTGTYDDQTKIVALTGGGYTLGGGYDPATGRLEGAFRGPGNSGTFLTTQKGNATVAYCGTFTGSDDGTFSFVVNNQNKILGNAYNVNGGAPIPLDGVKSGNSITIYAPGTTNIVLASGTISGSNASGTWDDHQGNTGTWSGSVCR